MRSREIKRLAWWIKALAFARGFFAGCVVVGAAWLIFG